jgi:hypothetical protein
MKRTLTVLAALALLACSQESALLVPTAPIDAPLPPSQPPPPAANQRTFVWAIAVDESGGCVENASIEVIRGQLAGQRREVAPPCGYWDYGGGALFSDLIPGVEMTLRLTAPGCKPQEKKVLPFVGPQTAFVFSPACFP